MGAQRKKYFINKSLAPVEVEQKEPGSAQSMDDMNNMMALMKGNTASYISNIGFMMWVNSFFAGFLLVRLPFSVSETFRPLVQRDVMLQPFDCSYVSSLSWYFISFFGLSGLNKLIIKKANQTDDDPDMKAMRGMSAMGMPMQQPPMAP